MNVVTVVITENSTESGCWSSQASRRTWFSVPHTGFSRRCQVSVNNSLQKANILLLSYWSILTNVPRQLSSIWGGGRPWSHGNYISWGDGWINRSHVGVMAVPVPDINNLPEELAAEKIQSHPGSPGETLSQNLKKKKKMKWNEKGQRM